ncbi:hypothetical protein BJ742DRAFT_854181 [Cladochytrium replicatum]|nr:hypothetical protein BJ742DRAFT_854181 [Cladochytrium replicatum]
MSSDDFMFVGLSGLVHALRKSSGEVVWSSKTGAGASNLLITVIQPHPPTSSLLVSAGPILVSISATNGHFNWKNKLDFPGHRLSMIGMEPSTNPMAVPAPESTSSQFIKLSDYVFVGGNRTVRALRLSDGADLWEFKTPLSGSCSTLPALLIEDGVLFVSGNRHVWALDPYKGKELWCTKLPSGDSYHTLATMRSSPLSRPTRFDPSSSLPYDIKNLPLSGLVFAGLSSLDMDHGTTVYLHPTPPVPTGSVMFPPEPHIIPLPSSHTAILSVGSVVRRVALSDNSIVWENTMDGMGYTGMTLLVGAGVANTPYVPVPAYSNPSKGSVDVPTIDASYHDRIFFAVNGKIHAISLSDGSKLWDYKPSFIVPGSLRPPFVHPGADGRVYIAAANYVYCLEAHTGEKLWESERFDSPFAMVSSYSTELELQFAYKRRSVKSDSASVTLE